MGRALLYIRDTSSLHRKTENTFSHFFTYLYSITITKYWTDLGGGKTTRNRDSAVIQAACGACGVMCDALLFVTSIVI